MNLVARHLNISNHSIIDTGYNCDKINEYNRLYSLKRELLDEIVINKIKLYINSIFETLIQNTNEINYYIENIIMICSIKFKELLVKLEIDNIIMILDYGKNKKEYKYYQNEYYSQVYENIENNIEVAINDNKYKLYDLLKNNWNKISFKNIIEFTKILNKFNYLKKNINKFKDIIVNNFDNEDNIDKLINYIINNFIIESIDDNGFINSKFNFYFIIDNLKSNGYLLFEKFNILIKKKYLNNNLDLNEIEKDIKIIKYFMFLIKNKESNTVNKNVNELLIKMNNFMSDIKDSYNYNLNYLKNSNVENDNTQNYTNKYKFRILKYNNKEDEIIYDFTLPNELKKEIRKYEEYYNNKYVDRELDYDLINSTIIVKMKFKMDYYIHMSLIQYIVLEKIYNIKGNILLSQISKDINIDILKLEDTINSLLKIKLIKKLSNSDEIILSLNNDFSMDDKKISISSLLKKEVNKDNNSLLHDRDTIIYCNLIDYIKKNTVIYEDTIIEKIQYKIPFKITEEMLRISLENTMKDNIIEKIYLDANKTQYIYKYKI